MFLFATTMIIGRTETEMGGLWRYQIGRIWRVLQRNEKDNCCYSEELSDNTESQIYLQFIISNVIIVATSAIYINLKLPPNCIDVHVQMAHRIGSEMAVMSVDVIFLRLVTLYNLCRNDDSFIVIMVDRLRRRYATIELNINLIIVTIFSIRLTNWTVW